MPGLFGVIETAAAPRSELSSYELTTIVRRMALAMRYEPFHSEDMVSLPELGACVGRVGFSDVKESDAIEDTGAVVAITIGELVSYLPVARASGSVDLGARTSVVIRAYHGGDNGLANIGGIAAGFIADRKRGRCLLFNDRYGRERMFVHVDGTRVYFSSEAKAILAVAPRTRALDQTGLAELLASGCTLGSRSLFKDIEILDSGSVMVFERDRVTRRQYFEPQHLEQSSTVSADEFLEGFSQSLSAAVNRFVSRSPKVGISITGGLDSRMIVALMDAPPGSVPCYTFGSMYRTTADVAVGRQVAAGCGQPHSVVELGRDFLGSMRETLQQSVYASDGYLGLSGAAELYVNRRARSIAPARMTGNWGGELMRGVRAFKYTVPKGNFLVPELAQQMADSAAAFSTTTWNPLSSTLFHQMPLQGYGRYAIERSQMVMRSPFLSDDVVGWLYRAPATIRESKAGAAAIIGHRPNLLAIPTDLGLLGARPSAVRRAVRRALIKAEYMTSHGAPDWVVKLGARLPASLLERRFLGVDKFQHFSFWTRRELAEFLRETLNSRANGSLGRWFDMARVEEMVNDHIAGRANYVQEIDKLLTVAVIEKTLFTPPQNAQ